MCFCSHRAESLIERLHLCFVQILQPDNVPISNALGNLGRDPEKEVYQLLVLLRCKPFLEPYVAEMRLPQKMGSDTVFPLGLRDGFHTLYEGVDFRYKAKTPYDSARPCVCTTCLELKASTSPAIATGTVLPHLY